MKNSGWIFALLIVCCSITFYSGKKRGYNTGFDDGRLEGYQAGLEFSEHMIKEARDYAFDRGYETGKQYAESDCDAMRRIDENQCKADLKEAFDLGRKARTKSKK